MVRRLKVLLGQDDYVLLFSQGGAVLLDLVSKPIVGGLNGVGFNFGLFPLATYCGYSVQSSSSSSTDTSSSIGSSPTTSN